jgi:FixJ family two-component response regulator
MWPTINGRTSSSTIALVATMKSGRSDSPTVYVVDDDPDIRHAMGYLLASVDIKYEIYESASKFLDSYNPNIAACLVLDIRMPGMSGLDLKNQLHADDIALPVIFVTGHGDVPMAVDAMRSGAFDFIQKPFRDQELLDRINEAMKANEKKRTEEDQRSTIVEKWKKLTPREKEVANLVVTGKPNKVIAYELDVSQRTVEIHRARVMEKTGAKSLAQLVRMQMQICTDLKTDS